MLKSELLEIIANGESSGVEFKRDDVRAEQVAKAIVAFANFQGGRVLLGVEDDGTISGLTRPDTEPWVMDTVFGHYVHPMMLPFYEEVLVDPGLRVGVITIPMGVTKPYVVRHNNREDIYVRMGKHSKLATREQQARLFASGALLHPEALAVSGTAVADLSIERLVDYLDGYIKDPILPTTPEAWEERLSGLASWPPRRPGVRRARSLDSCCSDERRGARFGKPGCGGLRSPASTVVLVRSTTSCSTGLGRADSPVTAGRRRGD